MVVLQKLELSCTITVHVPGVQMVVEVFEPNTTVGEITPVKDGAKKVKLHTPGKGVCVETGLMMLRVVQLMGLQPREKFVVLAKL